MAARYLLDTHVLLWALTADDRLGPPARAAISDGRATVAVSAASGWELAIKRSLGKLRMPPDLPAQLRAARIEVLPVTLEHGLAVADLPHHHKDPFDRLLIAAARAERLTLVTADAAFAAYDLALLRV